MLLHSLLNLRYNYDHFEKDSETGFSPFFFFYSFVFFFFLDYSPFYSPNDNDQRWPAWRDSLAIRWFLFSFSAADR